MEGGEGRAVARRVREDVERGARRQSVWRPTAAVAPRAAGEGGGAEEGGAPAALRELRADVGGLARKLLAELTQVHRRPPDRERRRRRRPAAPYGHRRRVGGEGDGAARDHRADHDELRADDRRRAAVAGLGALALALADRLRRRERGGRAEEGRREAQRKGAPRMGS